MPSAIVTRISQASVCPICSERGSIIRSFQHWREEHVGLHRCEGCGCEYLSPQPSDTWLTKEYRDYYRHRASTTGRPKAHYFETLLVNLDMDLSNRHVADLGAAEGDFAYALKQRWPTADLLAVEGNPESRPYFESLDCTYLNQDIEQWLQTKNKPRFDFIFLFDVLEHLRDPRAVLAELQEKCLLHDGKVIATFPSVDTISRRWLGRYWPQYKAEHLHYFSNASLAIMEQRCGLRRLLLRPLTKTLPLDYLLSVGSNFGPNLFRPFCVSISSIVPKSLSEIQLRLGFGECLWVAEKYNDR